MTLRSKKIFDEAFRYCFLQPCPVNRLPEKLQVSGERPVLHLIRRDLQQLYSNETENPPQEDKYRAPFLACIGIMSGIDLLSKFYDHRKSTGNRERFCNFLKQMGMLSEHDASLMWALRNALTHSYSLALEGPFTSTSVTLTTGPCPERFFIRETVGERHRYIIYFSGLRSLFLLLIDSYKACLSNPNNEQLRSRFLKRYNSHGYIVVDGSKKLPIS